MTERRKSFTEKENEQAFAALHEGEWSTATDTERGACWYKLNLSVTDNQRFSTEFINGYQDEERLMRVEPKTQ